jgi:hypothetical protein
MVGILVPVFLGPAIRTYNLLISVDPLGIASLSVGL